VKGWSDPFDADCVQVSFNDNDEESKKLNVTMSQIQTHVQKEAYEVRFLKDTCLKVTPT
jgi:hypothetical protein